MSAWNSLPLFNSLSSPSTSLWMLSGISKKVPKGQWFNHWMYLISSPARKSGDKWSNRSVQSGHLAFSWPLDSWSRSSQILASVSQWTGQQRQTPSLLFIGLTIRCPFLSYQLGHSHHGCLTSGKLCCDPERGDHGWLIPGMHTLTCSDFKSSPFTAWAKQ